MTARVRRFRNSQLALRRECGWACARTYIDGDEGVPSPPLRRGQDFHLAACEAIRQLRDTGAMDIHRIAYRCVRGGSQEYAEVVVLLERFQEAIGVEFDIDLDRILYLETTLEMPIELPSGETVLFRGTVDLAERTGRSRIRIRDWKTQWRPETEAEFRAGPQLKRYLLLAHHDLGGRELEADLEKRFIRYAHSHFVETLSHEDLAEVRRRLIVEIEEYIAWEVAGDYRPTPGSWCSLCSHHATCPVMIRARKLGVEDDLSIADDERARQLAEEAIAWDAGSGTRKELLGRYLGSDHPTGYVELAGGSYGYGPVEHRSVDVQALMDVFAEFGLELPVELLRVDLDQLDRVRKKLPEDVVTAIESRATRRWQTQMCRFRNKALPGQERIRALTAGGGAGETEDLFDV